MAATNILSAEVAPESTYLSLDSDGAPSSSGLTFTSAVITDMAQVTQVGEPAMTDVSTRARNSFCDIPREPASLQNGSGDYYERRSAEFDLGIQMNGIGDASGTIDAWSKLPFWNLLLTMLEESTITTPATDAVAAASTSTAHDTTAYSGFAAVGQMFKAVKDGRSDYSAVVAENAPEVTYSPAMVTALATADVCYPMRQASYPRNVAPETGSCAVRMSGLGWKLTAFGTVATKLTLNYTAETGRLDAVFSCSSPYIAWEDAADDTVAPVCPDGGVLHHLLTYAKISDTGGTACSPVSSPAQLAATAYCLDEMNIALTVERDTLRCGANIAGVSDSEVINRTFEGSITLNTESSAFDDDIWTGTMRSILIGFNSGDQTDPGEGGAVYIPAAVITNDPRMSDNATGHYRTMLNFGAGCYDGDSGTTFPANAPIRIALGETY